jgi:methylenetetrahydrofolate reductase (NADPH)
MLADDLRRKIELAEEQGLDLSIVTQFSFDPASVVRFCRETSESAPGVPVYAGLAGPTSPGKLLRFAKLCGVSTSMRAANKLGINAIKLATHSSPDKQFDVLASGKAADEAGNLAGIHLFSFGGFVDSAQWLDDKARSAGLGS